MKKRILAILLALVLVASSAAVTSFFMNQKAAELEQTRSEAAANLICRVDYGDEPVYVIGHKTPDNDTVASAIGMAHLLRSLGINAEPRIAGEVNLETEYSFSAIGYTAPEILENAAGAQLWLVDHSAESQAVDGAEDARIVGITDHHGIGDVSNSELICVFSCPAVSTSSIVYSLHEACGIELPKDIAAVLLTGLLSDSVNMKSSDVTPLDLIAFDELKAISGISDTDSLYNGMLDAKLSYRGMSDTEIFYSDYKDYECNGYSYGIGSVKVARDELIPAMAERMQKVIEAETADGSEADLLLYQVYAEGYTLGYSGFSGKDADFAAQIMDSAFGDIAKRDGGYYIFEPSLSRKKDIVPPIDEYLDSLPEK